MRTQVEGSKTRPPASAVLRPMPRRRSRDTDEADVPTPGTSAGERVAKSFRDTTRDDANTRGLPQATSKPRSTLYAPRSDALLRRFDDDRNRVKPSPRRKARWRDTEREQAKTPDPGDTLVGFERDEAANPPAVSPSSPEGLAAFFADLEPSPEPSVRDTQPDSVSDTQPDAIRHAHDSDDVRPPRVHDFFAQLTSATSTPPSRTSRPKQTITLLNTLPPQATPSEPAKPPRALDILPQVASPLSALDDSTAPDDDSTPTGPMAPLYHVDQTEPELPRPPGIPRVRPRARKPRSSPPPRKPRDAELEATIADLPPPSDSPPEPIAPVVLEPPEAPAVDVLETQLDPAPVDTPLEPPPPPEAPPELQELIDLEDVDPAMPVSGSGLIDLDEFIDLEADEPELFSLNDPIPALDTLIDMPEAEEPEEHWVEPSPRVERRSYAGVFLILSALLVVGAAVIVLNAEPPEVEPAPEAAAEPPPVVETSPPQPVDPETSPPPEVEEPPEETPEDRFAAELESIAAQIEAEETEAAAEALLALSTEDLGLTTEVLERYGELFLEAKAYQEARVTLRELRDGYPDHAPFGELLGRAYDEDPYFLPRVASLRPGRDVDSIDKLGGGSTISLKLKRKHKTYAAFKPLQTRYQTNYRSEIAAWRLCQLLTCHFDIPYNRPVRISRKHFDRLYSMSTNRQRNYAKNFTDLIWQNGWLYGTEKAWVPGFISFPIEDADVWTGWLAQSSAERYFDKPLTEVLEGWLEHERTRKAHERLFANHASGLTTRALAAQLSDLLVFDFLVGNWDRFSTNPNWWGTNCQFKDGRFVSIDNGAAFPKYTNRTVAKRFMYVEIFSRSLIRELRLLEREPTLERLFPNPSSRELAAFEVFWQQRRRVLDRVDALILEHGQKAVLAFD